ncbi:MAG: phosphotransferase [Caldilineaceae bacterium]
MTLQLLEHEEARLLDLLRTQLVIDWDQTRSHPLLGGLSGATVTRLAFAWQNTTPANRTREHLRPTNQDFTAAGVTSTVLKTGELAALTKEVAAYAQIPEEYQHYFGRIVSGPHATDDATKAYLLLEDLAGYVTLQEALCTGDQSSIAGIVEQLQTFLQRVYAIPIGIGEQSTNIDQIYLAPICRSWRKLARYRPYLLGFDAIGSTVERQLAALYQYRSLLNTFPRTIMHGDLHLRNIMVREIRPETGDLDFRLIDLEKFHTAGDLAHDIGELSMALANLCHTTGWSASLQWISPTIETTMTKALRQRGDYTFPARLELAKVRSLLKVMELDLKRLIPAAILSPEQGRSRSNFFIQLDLAQVQSHLAKVVDYLQACR